MKKILIALVLIGIVSCKKENITPQSNCNCGRIIDDNVSDYSVTIRNKCSGNTKKFYLTRGDWVNAFVGSDFCITNSGQW